MSPDDHDVPYLDRLRAELVGRIARRRRRRRTVIGVAAVGVALVVAGAIGPLGGSGGPSRALAISAEEKWISLEIVDPDADPERMTRELLAAGIDARVCGTLTTNPQLIGTWVSLGAALVDEERGLVREVGLALARLEPGPEPKPIESDGGIRETETGESVRRGDDHSTKEIRRTDDTVSPPIPVELRPDEYWLVEPQLLRIRADIADRPQPGVILLLLGQYPDTRTGEAAGCLGAPVLTERRTAPDQP